MASTTDPAKGQGKTLSSERVLTGLTAGLHDHYFTHDKNTLFVHGQSAAVRPYIEEHVDVEPQTKNPAFDRDIVFTFGNEGYSSLISAELHVEMPRLSTTGTYVTWVPYIMERLLGNDTDGMRIKFNNSDVRKVTPIQLHLKRRLCHDSSGTRRATYENAVGALADDASVAPGNRYMTCLWLPWSPDAISYQHFFPMHALGTEIEVRWRIPALAELVQSDGTVTIHGSSAVSVPTFHLRTHYVTTEADERYTQGMMLINPSGSGINFKTVQAVSEVRQQVAYNASTTTSVDIEINVSTNPAIFLVCAIRYSDDLLAQGATATASADTLVPQRGDGSTVFAPNWTRLLTANSWHLKEGAERVTPVYANHPWLVSDHGYTKYFPSDPLDAPVMTFTLKPCDEVNALGHKTFSNLRQPTLNLVLPPNVAAGGAEATREIDTIIFEHNEFGAKGSSMIRLFHTN